MEKITHTMIDLRVLEPHLIHPKIAQQAAMTKFDESFWLIVDHDPVELHEFLIDLGLSVQTFIFSKTDYRIFLGKMP